MPDPTQESLEDPGFHLEARTRSFYESFASSLTEEDAAAELSQAGWHLDELKSTRDVHQVRHWTVSKPPRCTSCRAGGAQESKCLAIRCVLAIAVGKLHTPL